MTMASTSVVLLTKGLLLFFVCSVTVWYLITPYLVRPHPKFKEDMKLLMLSEEKGIDKSKVQIENWTKWRLYIENTKINQTIYPQHAQLLEDQSAHSQAVFEWRNEYLTSITNKSGQVTIDQSLPWYSKYGLYDHFSVITHHNSVKFVPNFMFGLPNSVLESMYGGADKIPITGMMTSSTSMDRVIIQCYMNLVTIAIVYLISIHNPPNKLKATKQN